MVRRHQGQYTARDYRFSSMLKRYLTGLLARCQNWETGKSKKDSTKKTSDSLIRQREQDSKREIPGIFKYRKFQRILISVSPYFLTVNT